MAAIPLREETLGELKDKIVVISGSAHGIGLATVQLLYTHGAHVIHGDWDSPAGSSIDSSITSSSKPQVPGGSTTFVQTDVTDYDSVLQLFDTALKKHGRVDVAISNAGVQEVGGWFEKGLDLEGIRKKPTTKTLDVNLLGCIYFSRIACVYLKEGNTTKADKSLILVSSTAGFKETPGIFVYTAAKHGVLGLLRSLRPYLPKTHHIRTNAICPWMTDTAMVTGIRDSWISNSLPVNTPESVARVIVETALGTVPEGGERMKDEGVVEGLAENAKGGEKDGKVRYNGRAVFVEGGRGWDIESGIEGTEEVWLGEKVSRTLAKGQEVLGDGTDW
ncbi:putative 3-hydroxyacyl-CoA dehydrogenase [Cadophora sp. DSE1049]|nr:putative 3-hydroxyacyl-CoA dehydrogenase [Cadophora sp. DSE1049]